MGGSKLDTLKASLQKISQLTDSAGFSQPGGAFD